MKTKFWCFLSVALLICHCGGGTEDNSGGDDPEIPDIVNPIQSPAEDADLASLAQNTFIDAGINLSADPTYLEFEPTPQQERKSKVFKIINGTNEEQVLSMHFFGLSGGFRLIEEEGKYSAFQPEIHFASGETKEFTLEFDASRMGTHTGYLEITASGHAGLIRLPFRAKTTGAGNYRVIPSSFMCSNEDAPDLTILDFKKVVSGKTGILNFKICNTGGKSLTIHDLLFSANTSGAQSVVTFNLNPFTVFEWEIEETLNQAYAPYYNPPVDEAFQEPQIQEYTGPLPDPLPAFGIREVTTGTLPDNIVIAAGSHAKFEVIFAPNLDIEADDGVVISPVSYAADLVIETSLGETIVDAVGATSGREARLLLTYTTEESLTPVEIDLETPGAAIPFGTADIFSDWITEDFRIVTLTLKNTGNSASPLKVWFDPIHSGFFTYERRTQEQRFPLKLGAGLSKNIKMKFMPTPGEVSQSYDMGQLIVRHNGANGPHHRLTLVGEERETKAVRLDLNGSELRKAVSTKSLCAIDIGEGTPVEFLVHNNSTLPGNTLTSQWTVSDLDGATADPATGIQTTPPGQTAGFSIRLFPTVDDDEDITGKITVANTFALEGRYGVTLPPYEISFRAKASENGVCVAGEGDPLDGRVTIVIDRITMNLLLGIPEPTRNHPAFKFHLPVELNRSQGTARVSGLEFDPGPNVSPVKQIRSYAHQITSVNNCPPLPSNPYQIEFEEGSWDGPGETCAPFLIEGINVTPSAACMSNNGISTEPDPDDPTKQVRVFYHEFVKMNPTTCTPDIYGRISTFYQKEGQTVDDVFHEMEERFGSDGTVDEYASITRPFSFGSFIKFNVPYTCADGHAYDASSPKLTGDPDAIGKCWEKFATESDTSMGRVGGMIEECSYFQFTIEEGKIPTDMSNPDTWEGFGKYEPFIDPATDEPDETKYDMTIYNVHLKAFVLAHALNVFFSHEGRLLFSDLFVTLTTKAIGGQNPGDPAWRDLIAKQARDDFVPTDVFRDISAPKTKDFWLRDGVNSEFTAGGALDNQNCFDAGGNPVIRNRSCKGNYQITADGQYIVHAGEPIDFENGNRFMLAGLGGFHGKGNLAPGFAREEGSGKGQPLYFTFHSCLKQNPEDGSDLDENVGCYDPPHLDDGAIMAQYRSHSLLSESDMTDDGDPANGASKALINYIIFDEDRNRLTDYFSAPDNYFFDGRNYYGDGRKCGFGM